MKTAGNYIALQMLPFRWSPATGSADKQVVQIEGRAIFQGALASVGIVFFLKSLKKKKVKVAQSCPTLCDFMDHSPWNSPGQNTGVGSLSLLQGVFPTQGLNSGLLHCRRIFYQLSHSSVQFSRSVVSDSLRPHEPQHARPPCPSPTPGVYPNSCPLSQ